MKSTTKETFLSAFRHLLSIAGGAAVTQGLLSKDEMTQAVGLIITLLGCIWGPLDEYLAARQNEQDLRLKIAVEAAVAAALASQKAPADSPSS